MKYCLLLLALLSAQFVFGQIQTFPNNEGFENDFTVGDNVEFISHWKGNEVSTNRRIYQGSDARNGSASLNIIPISSFSGEVLISLDLTGINKPTIKFYAYSKQNGSASSDRPVLLSFSTSIDGGDNFLDNVSIGDETTFPNDNNTSFTEYEYELPNTAAGKTNVIVKFTAARGNGSGSSAELVMDDFSIVEQVLPLAISSVSAPDANTVQITFNQSVDQTTAENAANYTIDNGISINSATRSANNVVTLTTSAMPNNNYQLTINGVEDEASNTPANNLQDNFSYIEALAIESITVQNENSILVDFNLDLEETSAETLGNYSVNNSIGNPTSASLGAVNSDQVALTFASPFVANTYEVTVNNVTDESTLSVAANLTDNYDYIPLEIDNITVTSATTIDLDFNQDLETTSAETESNYIINFGRGIPTSAVQSGNNASIITLTISNPLVNNTYEITINNVTNTNGNATTSGLTTNAQFEVATSRRQIVINEIFADPSGTNDPDPLVLPTDEFVELYNTTSEAIDLTDFKLSEGVIGNFVLDPNSFVILTSTSDVANYQSFGDVIGVSSWNILTNGGEQLILRDNLGNQVDSLSYDLTWYQDVKKEDGGWTLEQINPEQICSDENNWRASVSSSGGTPGTKNSVYNNSPYITGPNISAINVNSPSQITVIFDEIIDNSSVASVNFSLENGLTVSNASLNLPYGKSITLTLSSAMTSGTIYNLTISNLKDCVGNAINGNRESYLFDNESPVFERFIFKTEAQLDIIFDEEVEETVAETESYFNIDQHIGSPKRATLNSDNRKRISLELDSSLSEARNFTLSYQNLTDTLGNTVALSNESFVFKNQLDTIIVISSQLLDISFDEDLDETSVETIANYIVDDGLGNPISASLDGTNPRLVHLVFDGSFPENSTTEIQFENIKDASLNYLQALNTDFTYDTDDPDVDSVIVVDENSIRIYFDERLDETSAETINNYSVDNGHGTPASATLQSNATSVILDFAIDFKQEIENSLTLTAIEDLSGNAISNNRNYDFTFDSLPPRLLGIDLINPTDLLLAFSEELIESFAEDVFNYSVDNGIGNPVSAVRSEENRSIVRLTFADLGNNPVNTLTIRNIVDLFSNNLVTSLQSTFSTQTPELGTFSILSDTSILLQFTKKLTQASAEEVENYRFDSEIGTFSLDQDNSDPSLVTVFLTTRLVEGEDYILNVNHLEDLDGNILESTTFDFVYSDFITQISIVNANTLELEFEKNLAELTAENTSNFILEGGIGNPLTSVVNSEDASVLTLFFKNALTEAKSYELLVQNLTDFFGNLIPASRNIIDFDVSAPIVISINSTFENEIQVKFNERVDRATATSLNHYSLNNGVGQPTSITLSTDARTVTLTFTNTLIDAQLYSLTLDRIEDLHGNAISLDSINFTFESLVKPAFRDIVINEVYFDNELSAQIPNYEFIELFNRSDADIEVRNFAVTDKSDTAYLPRFLMSTGDHLTLSTRSGEIEFDEYGNTLGITNFPSLANSGETIFLLDRDLNVIDSIQYTTAFYNDETKEDGGFTVELINPNMPCFDITNYAASTNPGGGTPGAQNSVYDISEDITSPSISNLEVISETQLLLTFSEAMDISTLDIANFSTSGPEAIVTITTNDAFGTSVSISLSAEFPLGAEQTLNISNVSDCSGNTLNTSTTFVAGAEPGINDVIITEIMASPSPSQGLPEREYVEVYNNSSQILSMSGLTIKDNNSETPLGTYDLNPGEYLILTTTAGTSELLAFGNVLGVTSFPTLTAEDIITLTNSDDIEVFSVDYDNSYYNDTNKDDGGYSMEMIKLNPACYDDANWTASTSALGGTPGTQNSVLDNSADSTSPIINSFTVLSSTDLEIEFSKSMNVTTLVDSNFILSGSLSIAEISQVEDFGRKISISLNQAFDSGALYTIAFNNITDCAGNALTADPLEFVKGATPIAGQLIITEIMANPTPSQGLPEVEYIEILNISDQILDLYGIFLADLTNSTVLGSLILEPGEYALLAPSSTANELNTFGKVLPVSNWPSLNNTADRITLFDSNSQEIYEVNYSEDWYNAQSKSQGGYSLEMIDTDYYCVEGNNWIGSNSANGGSPGHINTVDGDNPDLIGPEVIQAIAVTNSIVELTFNEKLDPSTVSANNFIPDHGLSFLYLEIDETNRIVTLVTSTDLAPNTLYTLSIDNITDCTGNLIPTSNQQVELIIAATAEPLDIIVNEILFNPDTGDDRFVEFYNNSSKYINLKGWKIAGETNSRVITEENLFILPHSYFVVTSNGDNIKSTYPNAIESTFIEVSSMPRLPSDNGTVLILNSSNIELDRLEYSEAFHSNLLNDPNGISLERLSFSGESNDQNNWFTASETEGGATPGYENSQSFTPQNQIGEIRIEPSTFAPDIPGGNNFTTLNYSFDQPGNTINIRIVDVEGRIIKQITQNTVVGTKGFFTWDGSTEEGRKARIGYYMILMEIINTDGKISYRREKVAIGSRF